MLVVLTCSVTGALSAAECQVMKWDVDRSEVKVRAEKKTRHTSKKKTKPNPGRVKSILYLGLNLKHVFMGS